MRLKKGKLNIHRLKSWPDRLFHRNKSDYLGTLQQVSAKIKEINELDSIINTLMETIVLSIEPDKVILLLPDEEGKQYVAMFPVDKRHDSLSLPSVGILASLLKNTRNIMTQQEIEIVSEFQALTIQEQKFLNELEAELVVPLNMRDNLIGILALSHKLSGRDYSPEEVIFLKLLSCQMAIALDNERLCMLEKKAKENLQREFKERTEFVDALIHEVKTPLTAMLAYSELLKEELLSKDAVLCELASNMNDAVHSLNRRISELVQFTKLQHTDITINLQDINIGKVVNESASHVAGLLLEKNQTIKVEVHPSLGLVRCDPERLMQILLNLLTNAAKYGPAGDLLLLKAYQLNDNAIIEVCDGGQPIPGEEHESLFTPYQQGLHKVDGGLGLGLYICKKLVELHGGNIWLESKDTGNEFKFSLPLADQET